MANLRQALSAARSRARVSREEMTRTISGYAAAAAIGMSSRANDRGEVPMHKLAIGPLPGTAVVAIGAKVLGMFAPGQIGNAANGVADAGAHIAIANYAMGHRVEGVDMMSGRHSSSRRRRAAAARLERELTDRLHPSMDPDEAELSAIEMDD